MDQEAQEYLDRLQAQTARRKTLFEWGRTIIIFWGSGTILCIVFHLVEYYMRHN